MRTIKFRGKVKNLHDSHCCGDLNDGTWVVGDLEIHRKDERKIIHFYKEDGSYYRQYDVDENTIGQFTGLLDKNGNEIYEGDIVIIQEFKKPLGVVTWHDCGYFFIDTTNGEWKHFGNRFRPLGEIVDVVRIQIEVIGNIHDNPELLKKITLP